jgi:hypothetical protein
MNWSDRDHYEAYYANKLWQLLPAVYRAEDSALLDQNGPLRELVDRLGEQAAVLRRSLDRLWADQSIETCEDWVIAYIGDLLATNLVVSLDARGQRLDVAKTIYYRRRKGTVAVLEEIATDITGWDARLVEFFRRMGRTRHNFDPEIGLPSETDHPEEQLALQQAQGLVGALTKTPIGGWADLRNTYGATKAHSAFDEFFSTADLRRGRGQVGWHNIPRLGVFLWRLRSFGLNYTTPVAVKDCPGHYTFDPTGRGFDQTDPLKRLYDPTDPLRGLFAKSSREFGDRWVSPVEWQLPAPISRSLLTTDLAAESSELYDAINSTDNTKFIPNSLGVYRQAGNFYTLLPAALRSPTAHARPLPEVTIYPQQARFKILKPQPNEVIHVTYHYGFSSTVGAGSFDRRLITTTVNEVPEPISEIAGGVDALATTLTTLAPTGTITLLDSLTYTAVNDVGSNTNPLQDVTIQAKNRARPVLRPLATAPNPTPWIFYGAPGSRLVLTGLLISGIDIVLQGEFDSVTLNCCTLDPGHFDPETKSFVAAVDGKELKPCHLWIEAQVDRLTVDHCITGPIGTRATGNVAQLSINNSILQAFDLEKTLNFTNGDTHLNRCTVLGGANIHRLEASECILNDVVRVENPQQGCVRFSAWARGSILPRPYESVEISPAYPLFTSRVFGHPSYAQLQLGNDAAILSFTGGGRASIWEGAEDGSEMGVFAREQNAIKERSLRLKYEEYMPLGLIPVIIYVN